LIYFRSRIYLLIFCLDDLSIDDDGVLKSLTTTVLELIYAFRSFRVCLMKLGALTLGPCRLVIVTSFWSISPFISLEGPSFISFGQCKFEVYFVRDEYATPACFQGPLAW
jgi:hypothetical protein